MGTVTNFPARTRAMAVYELSQPQFNRICRALNVPVLETDGDKDYFAMVPDRIGDGDRLTAATLVSSSNTAVVIGEPLAATAAVQWRALSAAYEAQALNKGWYVKRVIGDSSLLDQLRGR